MFLGWWAHPGLSDSVYKMDWVWERWPHIAVIRPEED